MLKSLESKLKTDKKGGGFDEDPKSQAEDKSNTQHLVSVLAVYPYLVTQVIRKADKENQWRKENKDK